MTDLDPAVTEALERTRPRANRGADWDDVVRRTAGTPHPVQRRPLVRALRWAPGLAGGVAIAAVLGVMVVRSGDAPPSAAPKGVTGVEALVRVASTREGQTDEQAAERMETVLTERARIQGITGFRVERSGAALSVFVPRTQSTGWVRQWIGVVPALRVVDGKGGVVRSGFDPIAVARAIEVPDASGPVVFYALVRGARPGQSFVVGPYASRSEAVARARKEVARQTVRIVAVPARAWITMRLEGGRIRFEARRDGLTTPGAVTAVDGRGPRVVLTITDDAGVTLTRGLRSFVVPALDEVTVGARSPFAGWDPLTGELQFRAIEPDARRIGYMYAGGQADALTTTVSAERVGPVPKPRGRPAPAPAALRESAQHSADEPILWETFRRAVTATSRRGTWWVWTAEGEAGWSTAGVISPNGWSFGGCDVDPARPVVTFCGATWENPRRTRVAFGRVGDAVRAVTVVSRDGTRTAARVANGFYLALVPIRSGRLRAIVASGEDGRPLSSITADDPVWGPSF